MLLNVLLISGGLHLVALLVLGGITVVKFIIPDEAQFEEPPALEEVEPPKQVKIEIKQQAAPQQTSMQNLRMKQVGNITVANVDVDLPTMDQSFTVSAGLGGFGGGSLLGGTRGSIGIGMSDVSIFGLKSRAERILFAVDASKTMLTDEKGGLNSYRVIKDEITTMVANLSAGTLFNVVFFDDGKTSFFKPNLVPAGVEVSQELIRWITPINRDVRQLGLPGGQRLPLTAMPGNPMQEAIPTSLHWSSQENAYLTQLFIEQSVDAIFWISASHEGFQRLFRPTTAKEQADWDRRVASSEYQRALAAFNEEYPQAMEKAKRLLADENAQRQKRGQPPRIFDGGNLVRNMGVRMNNPHPGNPPKYYYEAREVRDYFRDLKRKIEEARTGRPPSINVVLFLAGDEVFSDAQKKTLDDYVRFFGGNSRVIRGLDEIKSAASAKDSIN